jgi:MFS family permease
VWGVISDRVGRKPAILASNIIRIAAITTLILSTNLVALAAFALLIGFSALFMVGNPARSALILESTSSQERAAAFGVIMAASQTSLTLASFLCGYISAAIGYRAIFCICAAGDAVGLIMLLFLKETFERRKSKDSGHLSKILEILKMEEGTRILYLIMVVAGISYGVGYSIFYGALVDKYGFTPYELGLLSMVFNLTWGISSIPASKFADRYGYRAALLASWAMATVTAMGFLTSKRLEALLLFHFTGALDPALWVPAWMALVTEAVPSDMLSTVIGKLDAYSRLVSAPASWIAGALYSSFGFAAPLTAHMLLLVLSGLLIFFMKGHKGSRCLQTSAC